MDKTRIIIDTDIGDDVDDALAIALALRSPEIDILGITTVYKNVEMRTQLVLDLLQACSTSDIPVATGYAQPIRYSVDESAVPHQCRFLSERHPPNCEMKAVEFIVETVRKYPDVVIVAIGPFTNIGMAIKLEPELMRRTRLVAMGGAFSAVYPEYNILCDPEAANIVINSGAKIEMLGLDVTTQCVLSKMDEQAILRQTDSMGRYLARLTQVWLETSKSKKITLHDPLTIGYLIRPELLTMEMEPVQIELEGTFTRGLTALCRTPFRQRAPYPDSVVSVAKKVQAQQMRDMLFERLFQSC